MQKRDYIPDHWTEPEIYEELIWNYPGWRKSRYNRRSKQAPLFYV